MAQQWPPEWWLEFCDGLKKAYTNPIGTVLIKDLFQLINEYSHAFIDYIPHEGFTKTVKSFATEWDMSNGKKQMFNSTPIEVGSVKYEPKTQKMTVSVNGNGGAEGSIEVDLWDVLPLCWRIFVFLPLDVIGTSKEWKEWSPEAIGKNLYNKIRNAAAASDAGINLPEIDGDFGGGSLFDAKGDKWGQALFNALMSTVPVMDTTYKVWENLSDAVDTMPHCPTAQAFPLISNGAKAKIVWKLGDEDIEHENLPEVDEIESAGKITAALRMSNFVPMPVVADDGTISNYVGKEVHFKTIDVFSLDFPESTVRKNVLFEADKAGYNKYLERTSYFNLDGVIITPDENVYYLGKDAVLDEKGEVVEEAEKAKFTATVKNTTYSAQVLAEGEALYINMKYLSVEYTCSFEDFKGEVKIGVLRNPSNMFLSKDGKTKIPETDIKFSYKDTYFSNPDPYVSENNPSKNNSIAQISVDVFLPEDSTLESLEAPECLVASTGASGKLKTLVFYRTSSKKEYKISPDPLGKFVCKGEVKLAPVYNRLMSIEPFYNASPRSGGNWFIWHPVSDLKFLPTFLSLNNPMGDKNWKSLKKYLRVMAKTRVYSEETDGESGAYYINVAQTPIWHIGDPVEYEDCVALKGVIWYDAKKRTVKIRYDESEIEMKLFAVAGFLIEMIASIPITYL